MKLKVIYPVFLAILLCCACTEKKQQEKVVAPWGEISDSIPTDDDFDLTEIQSSGEMILLTLSGPEYYYDYHGRHLGTQYLLAEKFAARVGVRLRVEVCRDSAEMADRLQRGEGDIMASTEVGKLVASPEKDELEDELREWYQPSILEEVRKQEAYLLSNRSVKRRVFSPMLNRENGIISHYDSYFQRYAATIRWDWRLMAAQCYQESTFDPQAHSWAGACGLMQIMPSTADHLGLPRSSIYDPEQNIAAAARYLGQLDRPFSDISERSERIKFVLAAYNGGHFHIRDAMALATKNGKNAHRWGDVEPFVLGLSQPQYYNDPMVKNGYMRGSETVDYVRKIHERWNGYRGIRTVRNTFAPSAVPQKATHERKKKYQI